MATVLTQPLTPANRESPRAEIAATDIAVVGRALRVPGARTVREFWDNLRAGVESIRRLTDKELLANGVDPGLLTDPAYIKVGAPLEDMQLFDAGFFGFSPREAAIMDPQHRHFLEVAWEALEDAGHVPESFAGRIGVFGGSGMNAYMPYHLFTNPKLMAAAGLFLVRHTGNDKDFLTTRVSYLFDLRGPSVNIQTACSTSLVAIHTACQSLISHECDLALAGGVTIEMPHGHGYVYQEGEILSDDGHCRAFDRRAKGTIFGSGAGLVVLRRLDDAIADGDTIYAVVKGSAVNNDGGRKVGYLAPSVDGQAEAIAEALHLSGVPADSITYVECHGTGTPVGDPIEVAGLTHAFRSLTDRTGFCAIGSAKTNIGHLDTAAGVASFLKVVEMLRHRTLVPNLHFKDPNPEVDWGKTPFFVSDRTAPWSSDGPRRASVNSLGVGGTNAHVVLEEGPPLETSKAVRAGTVLVLSARSKASLDRATTRLADRLEVDDSLELNDVAFTLATGRRRFPERRAIVATTRQEAIAVLRSAAPTKWLGGSNSQSGTKVAFLFPGGGAQHPGMALDLYESEPVFRSHLERSLALMSVHEGLDLRPVMFPAAGTEDLAAEQMLRPSLALPALLAIELAVAELLRSWGIVPVAMLGHSMGEYAAAQIAGVFSLRDALAVVTCRGRLFETLPEGAMLSVPLPEADVAPELTPGLSFAAVNGPGLCLVSGEVGAIVDLESRLAARGIEARRLAITVAAHSQMLDPILGEFEAYLRRLTLSAPTLPFVSNVTGTWIRPEEARDPSYWVKHLRQPVRFADGLSTLTAEGSHSLLEVGPGRTLSSLAQAHPTASSLRLIVPALRHPKDPITDGEAILAATGRLWAAGVDLDWKAFFGTGRRRVSLPTYAFDHERHWIEPGAGFFLRPERTESLERKQNRADWTYRHTWRLSEPSKKRPHAVRNILVFQGESEVGHELVLDLRAAGHTVDVVRAGEVFSRDEDGFRVPSGSRADHARLLRELAASSHSPSQIVHLGSVDESDDPAGPETASEKYLLPLVSLAQALIDEEPSGGVELVVVTNGADGVGRDAGPRFPLKALTQGPVRVIPREMPSMVCRSIDLPGVLGSGHKLARALLMELDEAAGDVRVAFRDGERFAEAYERWPLSENAEPWRFRQRGVVLITGGLGGIALALAERLALSSEARFVLVGRTAVPAREHWADMLARLDPGDPIVARIHGIQAIEAAGGAVLSLAVDVADPDGMRRAVEQAEARFGAVHAAIHAAGAIDDAPLHSKESNGIEAVLRAKVAGAVALVEALRGRSLDFLTFFSSTSVALGPAGQVDYVAANAFLNVYAHQLAAEGLPVRALQWGAWREVGMAVAALAPPQFPGAERVEHPLLQRRLHAEGGATVFPATLNSRSWVLDEHRVRGAEPVLPGTGFVEMMRAALVGSDAAPATAAIELSDVAFTSPLIVPDNTVCSVETEVRDEGDGSVSLVVRSGTHRGSKVEHASARGRALPGWVPGTIDIAALEARCTLRVQSFEPGAQSLPQERLLDFGPRWKAVCRLAFGRDEAVARLELSEAYASDLEVFGLHPAVLDMATGCAFAMVEGAPADFSLFVPLSYGRLRSTQRLPRRLVSHVRRRPGSREGVAVLDATLADEQGRVLVEIEGYVVKSVESKVLRSARKVESARSPLERWVEHGILPDEGFDLFGRVVGQRSEVQVLVSPLDLHGMTAELRPAEHPTPLAPAAAGDPAPVGAAANQVGVPRDDIERKLAAFWSDLLGVETIHLEDSFFDLGGHSLIAVRLFARIRKTWAVDLPLATLFSASTLETLAAAVRERLGLSLDLASVPNAAVTTGPSRNGWTPLVPIRKSGSRRPFFCVHGAGGNLLNFRDFVERLAADQPVFGLEARGVDGQLPPAESIEEMAEMYLEAIRGVQARGPYLIGGYSGGGVVALEIARRLAAAGEHTANVVLLDTFHPSTSARDLGWRDHVDGLASGGLGYLRVIASAVVTRHTTWSRQDKRLRECLSHGESVPHELREWYIATSFLNVLRRHTPAPYAGKVTLFRAQEMAKIYDHTGLRLGWDSTTLPDLDVLEVPGGHDSLVREPNVRILAEQLEDLLRRGSSVS